MILPISTSKPSGSSVSRLMLPSPGWSNLVPILIDPASARLGHRGARGELGRLLDRGVGGARIVVVVAAARGDDERERGEQQERTAQ